MVKDYFLCVTELRVSSLRVFGSDDVGAASPAAWGRAEVLVVYRLPLVFASFLRLVLQCSHRSY